ncbi:hypothetical protein [Pedobacter sp.]
MKALNTTKLAKKTVFVYKNIKSQNNFSTGGPLGDMGQTQTTAGTFGIF